MIIPRIIDPNKFILLGAVTDWLAVSRRHLSQPIAGTVTAAGQGKSSRQIAAERKLASDRIVQLRWLGSGELGYPSEPFKVWRRPAMPMQTEKPVNFTQTGFLGQRLVVLEQPKVFARVRLQATTSGVVMAFAGAPMGSALIAIQPIHAGYNELQLSGAAIQSLLVSALTNVQSISGLDQNAAEDKNWQLMEVVGLPVDKAWAGVLDLDQPQGLASALTSPEAAALDRFRRGAPFFGWEAAIAGVGAAPVWQLANDKALLKAMGLALPALRDMVTTLPPNRHHEFQETRSLPPLDPVQPGDPAKAILKPLHNLLFGAATDPLASLISGYGTAFVDEDIPPIVLSDRKLFDNPNRSDWDYMVTARYAKGPDGRSGAAEYAAIVFAPFVGTQPPVPTNLGVASAGLRSPRETDKDWHAIERVSWDKVPDALPFRVGSYAFARKRVAPAGGVEPLMGKRLFDTALQPISATTNNEGNQSGRLTALDETYGLSGSPNPNVLSYALAHQDLFGLWSPWSSVTATVAEPPVQTVPLLSARLDPAPSPPETSCTTQLVIEFSWDWATRSPRRIEIAGRLYAQAKLGDRPADLTVPAVLQTSLGGGAGSLVRLDFNGGNAPTITVPAGITATLAYLSLDGKELHASPVVARGPRRYRLTLQGLSLDFDAAGRIGMALWAHGIEQRSPQRVGEWSAQPLVTSTADPRPPKLTINHEKVLMASVADAHGEHHALLTWPFVSTAVGYVVYSCSESKLRADRGLGDPDLSLTLSERLVKLRDAFEAKPDRRSFSRVNMEPVKGLQLQVTLPRGSKEIHLYVVLALSAGQVESPWPPAADPDRRKRPMAYAAPQIVVPSPPDLEVTRVLDSATPPAYRADIRIRTKPGAPVVKVDLHRVRVPEAAVELDTMGPPVARITGSAGTFHVDPTVSPNRGEAQDIGLITGMDTVEGSWRRVFYRAVAWAGDDESRGLYGTRSRPSALREVIVPPASPPNLAPLSWQWPGGGLGDARIDSSTLAPADTPLGPHRLRADVLAELPDGSTTQLYQYPAAPGDDDTLASLPTTPPGAGQHGLWRDGPAAGVTALHLLARRASTDHRLKVRLLITDPLGRITEQVLDVPPGSPLPEPDIISPNITLKPSKGFIIDFGTTVPFSATPIGPYVLAVKISRRLGLPQLPQSIARPALPRALGQPARASDIRAIPVPPPTQTVSAQVALNTITAASAGQDIFALAPTIPVLRSKGPMGRPLIALGVRGTGRADVEISIVSPDGRRATYLLQVG